jgi:hypothetical protein
VVSSCSCGISCSTPIAITPMVAAAASGAHHRHGPRGFAPWRDLRGRAFHGAMRRREDRVVEGRRRRFRRLRAPCRRERGVVEVAFVGHESASSSRNRATA